MEQLEPIQERVVSAIFIARTVPLYSDKAEVSDLLQMPERTGILTIKTDKLHTSNVFPELEVIRTC